MRIVQDPDELDAFYRDLPAAHIYAFCDLEAPFWEPSTWFRRDDAVVGFVQLGDDGETTVYAVATRNPAATLTLLTDLLPLVPAGALITAPDGLTVALRGHREVEWQGPHLRFELVDPDAALAHVSATAVPLGSEHLADLIKLYDSEPGAAFFLPNMVNDGTFVGVYDGTTLVAAAGTHVISETMRCAAIGSVYTRPSHRGQGLGKATTAGVVSRLAGRVDLIGLNVASDNIAARATYERLGFTPVLSYEEAQLH